MQKKSFNSNHGKVDQFDFGKICIVRGKSPRGDFGHVIVGKISTSGVIEMIHDPHPDGSFLNERSPFGWYMVFD